MITISPLTDRPPGLGDVLAVVQRETGKLIIHRVVKKRGDNYLLRGDNSSGPDGLEPRANILGLVKRVERDNERVFLGLGPERFLIAFLNRQGLTIPLVRLAVRLLHLFRRL